MGGEMIYILNQRLIAQRIPADKGDKVRADVIKHLFSEEFIRELLIPQPLYSMTSTRQVFDKIAQSSIMKLQTSSMNKLFDLMLMGLKMQLLTMPYPEQLLKITLNHLQELSNLVNSKESKNLLTATGEKLVMHYVNQSSAVWNRIRQTLLRFFQNRNVKVTMFLHSGIQLQDGTIKINSNEGVPLAETPGTIASAKGLTIKTLPNTGKFVKSIVPSRHPLQAITSLGINLYDSEKQAAAVLEEHKEEKKEQAVDKNREAIAKWELNSLAAMIAPQEDENSKFDVVLFNDVDIEIKETRVSEVTGVLKNTHLEEIARGLEVGEKTEKNEDDELLDLL